MFRVRGAEMRQQCRIAQMPTRGDLPPPRQVLMETGYAHPQHPALLTDRPDPPMAFDEGMLHFWAFSSRVARMDFTSALS
jgi:hypothetical protein